ncbi:MAG: heparan-alpha-glucosaminide N-acetyltransferase domain-containing protein [Planctomycetota bacterium]|jgi:predicted acyltransferase
MSTSPMSMTNSVEPDSIKDSGLPSSQGTQNKRLTSLDQFRGYTVLGMLIVNYFGGYIACPQVWKHTNDYLSYADTIMPQFLFAVGFSLRLTVGRQLQTGRTLQSYSRIIRRLLGLALVAFVVYNVSPRAANWEQLKEIGIWGAIQEPLKRQWFQTLMHIAVTSLWIIPVIHRPLSSRLAWLIGSAIAHVILSYLFNFSWCNTNPNAIDGGPLGFLTWTIPAILGTFACDWFVPDRSSNSTPLAPAKAIGWSVITACLLMLLGYGFSCGTRFYDVIATPTSNEAPTKLASDPVVPDATRRSVKFQDFSAQAWLAEAPFVKPPDATKRQWNYWMMSQRAGTLSYLTFAAGFSLAVFVLFYVLCDIGKFEIPLFKTFGVNALAAYVLHDLTSNAIQPFFPKDSPAWYAFSGLFLFCFITWLILRSLQSQKIFLRV